MSETDLHVQIDPEQKGMRLDRCLADHLPEFSRNRLRNMIEQGAVTLDGATIRDHSYRVKPDQQFVVRPPAPIDPDPVAEDIPLNILFEDEHLIVVVKPAGMVVHPAPGNYTGTLVNALLHHCGDSLSGIGGVKRPGIVHRLDKDTSGVMVVAKTDQAHQGLSDLFHEHDIDRRYVALVWGRPGKASGRIESYIARDGRDRKRMIARKTGSKLAVTDYRIEKWFGETATLVECTLHTGRTHQIRVHMQLLGCPVIGDSVYAKRRPGSTGRTPKEIRDRLNDIGRQALHARVLGFIHPVSGEEMHFEAEPPTDMQELVEILTNL